MKIAVIQSYWFPYIGYWQLIHAVDVFVIYDNIQYTKKGWINRNRFLLNGSDCLFTLPLKKGSDFLDVCEREIADTFEREGLLRKITNAYRKAPYANTVLPLLREWLYHDDTNLFRYILATVRGVCGYLGIDTRIVISSTLAIDHSLRAAEKVKAICGALHSDTYINAIGGQGLYSKDDFARRNIDLKFIMTREIRYPQFGAEFVPWLSIIDIMMFNSREEIRRMLNEYDLV